MSVITGAGPGKVYGTTVSNPGVKRANQAQPGPEQADDARLQELCREFESFFLAALLREAKVGGAGSAAVDQTTVLADQLTRSGGLGLGDRLYQSLRTNRP